MAVKFTKADFIKMLAQALMPQTPETETEKFTDWLRQLMEITGEVAETPPGGESALAP